MTVCGIDRKGVEGHEYEHATTSTRFRRKPWRGLGGGKLAYVKTIRSEDVQKHFPQAPELAAGTLLYALHAADGTPIMLTDSREAAIANAWSNELETLSVH